jgi:hypothetical protein
MTDELPPYEGQNWLMLTDDELRHLADGYLTDAVASKARRLKQALINRLSARRQLEPQAEAIPSHVRTDRGGLAE